MGSRSVGGLALLLSGWLVACAPGQEAAGDAKTAADVDSSQEGASSAVDGDGGGVELDSTGAVVSGPKMNPEARAAFDAGVAAYGEGDLPGAVKQFQAAIAADSLAYRAHYSLALVEQRLGSEQRAQEAFERTLRTLPTFEPAISAYAVMLARRGNVDEAERFLKERMAAMPKSAAVTATYAEVRSLAGDSGGAQRLAQEALKKNPDYRPAMVTLARDHYRNRRLDLAMEALKGILDGYGAENPPRDKDNAEALTLRGLIYKEQGNRAGAMEALKRAVELRGDLVEARLHLATYLLEAGNATEAVKLLEMAARYAPTDVYVRLNLGDAYRLLGKPGAAYNQLQWVIKKEPELAQAYYDLGLLYLFSEQVPGFTELQAVERAIDSLGRYKELAGRGDGPTDTDELITRAQAKKALLEATAAEQVAAEQAASTSSSGEASGQSEGGAP